MRTNDNRGTKTTTEWTTYGNKSNRGKPNIKWWDELFKFNDREKWKRPFSCSGSNRLMMMMIWLNHTTSILNALERFLYCHWKWRWVLEQRWFI